MKSTLLAVRKENDWQLPRVDNEGLYRMTVAARALLRQPSMRVVRLPVSQVVAFCDMEDALLDIATSLRPPFDATFLDFGFAEPGSLQLAGASLVWHDDENRWSAIAYARWPKSDEWSTMYVDPSQHVVGSPPRAELIGPRRDRPDRTTRDFGDDMFKAIVGSLAFMESANVDLVEADPYPRWHQAHGIPHHEVVIRQATKRYVYGEEHVQIAQEWSHRWEVRGHFKHFRRGSTYDRNADRQIQTSDGDRFVRVWCPPHVKGPADKPLVPKVRTTA